MSTSAPTPAENAVIQAIMRCKATIPHHDAVRIAAAALAEAVKIVEARLRG